MSPITYLFVSSAVTAPLASPSTPILALDVAQLCLCSALLAKR